MTPFDRFAALNLSPSEELTKTSAKRLDLPDSEYALVVKTSGGQARHLPMHNTLSCADSVALLLEKGESLLPPLCVKTAAARLLRRMDQLGVENSDVRSELEHMASQASPDVLYWGEVDREWTRHEVEKASSYSEEARMDLPVLHRWELTAVQGEFEVTKVSDIQKCSHWFSRNLSSLSETDRRAMALGIADSYAALGADLENPMLRMKVSTVVPSYAGRRVREDARDILLNRPKVLEKTSHFNEPDVLSAFDSAYRSIADEFTESVTVEKAEELAAMVAKLDKESGVRGMTPAYQAIFYAVGEAPGKDLTKVAATKADENTVYQFHQTTIRRKHLKALKAANMEKLEKVLGEDAVDALRQDPIDVFKSLPKPHKDIVAKFVEEYIVLPAKDLSKVL